MMSFLNKFRAKKPNAPSQDASDDRTRIAAENDRELSETDLAQASGGTTAPGWSTTGINTFMPTQASGGARLRK